MDRGGWREYGNVLLMCWGQAAPLLNRELGERDDAGKGSLDLGAAFPFCPGLEREKEKGKEKGKGKRRERKEKERKGCQFFISLFPPLPLLAGSCTQLLQHLESLGHRLGLLEDVCARAELRHAGLREECDSGRRSGEAVPPVRSQPPAQQEFPLPLSFSCPAGWQILPRYGRPGLLPTRGRVPRSAGGFVRYLGWVQGWDR